jgi:hypothetical protein
MCQYDQSLAAPIGTGTIRRSAGGECDRLRRPGSDFYRAAEKGSPEKGNEMPRRSIPLVLCCAVLLSGIARADDIDRQIAALFDHPAATKTTGGNTDAQEGQEIRCTYFKDIMIRETGTDTPAPGAATISPVAGGAPLACGKAPVVGEMPLKTENFTFIGRKGPFLFFSATDPNGAIPFILLDAATGKAIYSDALIGGKLKTVALENGSLHLRFTRGVNGSCSLLKDAAACWAKMASEGAIPAAVALTPPPVKACAAAYRRSTAPPDDPSIVFYDVDMTVTLAGRAEVKSRGAVGCDAMP